MKAIFFFLIIIFVTSCKNSNSKNNIDGIWIFQWELSEQYLYDSIDINHYSNQIIFDFKPDKELVFKKFGVIDTIIDWNLNQDSILSFFNEKYKIKSISDKNMILINFKYKEPHLLKFSRPEKLGFNVNPSKIEKLLVLRIWRNKKPMNVDFEADFEFLKNHIMIFETKFFDDKTQDSNFQYKSFYWGLEKYKSYMFLYDYDYSFHRRIRQISELTDTSFTLIDNVNGRKAKTFVATIPKDSTNYYRNLLIGNWVSENKVDSQQSKDFNNNRIRYRNGGNEAYLYDGEIYLKIDKDKFTYRIQSLQPQEYKWTLSKDSKTLILEDKMEEINNNYVIPLHIFKLNENVLKIDFKPEHEIGKYKPSTLIVNNIQEFIKVY
jgi:hypothetical protein